MQPPVYALALLFLGPPLFLLLRRAGAVTFAVAALLGFAFGAPQVPGASLIAAPAGLALCFLTLPGGRAAWGLGAWAACMTLPLWAPRTAGAWQAWPPAALSSGAWDPSLMPPLYEDWGAGLPLAAPSLAAVGAAWWTLAVLAAVAARFAVILSRGGGEPPTP